MKCKVISLNKKPYGVKISHGMVVEVCCTMAEAERVANELAARHPMLSVWAAPVKERVIENLYA